MTQVSRAFLQIHILRGAYNFLRRLLQLHVHFQQKSAPIILVGGLLQVVQSYHFLDLLVGLGRLSVQGYELVFGLWGGGGGGGGRKFVYRDI